MEHHSSEHETKESEVQPPAQQNNLSIPVAIVIAGVLIAGAVYLGTSKGANTVAVNNQQGQQAAQQQPSAVADVSKVKTAGEPFVGNPSAQVTVAYWYDYQCPFCKRFEEDAMSQLMNDYVKTGKVKVVFKDFQFLGPDSQTAGLAERAV